LRSVQLIIKKFNNNDDDDDDHGVLSTNVYSAASWRMNLK